MILIDHFAHDLLHLDNSMLCSSRHCQEQEDEHRSPAWLYQSDCKTWLNASENLNRASLEPWPCINRQRLILGAFTHRLLTNALAHLSHVFFSPFYHLMLFTFSIDDAQVPQFFRELEALKRLHETSLPNICALPQQLYIQPGNGAAPQPALAVLGTTCKPTTSLHKEPFPLQHREDSNEDAHMDGSESGE